MGAKLETDIVVRPVRTSDAEALGRVHAQCWHETYDNLIPSAVLENISVRRLAELWAGWAAQGPEFVRYAALVDGEIIGFAGSSPARDENPPAPRELVFIYLLQSYQGTGAGQKLFDAVIAQDEPAYLWVNEDNPRAHRFYERNGFVKDGATHQEPFLGEIVTEVRFSR